MRRAATVGGMVRRSRARSYRYGWRDDAPAPLCAGSAARHHRQHRLYAHAAPKVVERPQADPHLLTVVTLAATNRARRGRPVLEALRR